MAKKKSAPRSSSLPTESMAGFPADIQKLCKMLGLSEAEFLSRLEEMVEGQDLLEDTYEDDLGPPVPRQNRPIDPTSAEWKAFDILLEISIDDPRGMKRDIKRALKLDPLSPMVPIVQAFDARSAEEDAQFHHRALELVGDRFHAGNALDLCGGGDPQGHPWGAAFIGAHRFLGRHALQLHKFQDAIPHLQNLIAVEFETQLRSTARGCVALCYMYARDDASAQKVLQHSDDESLVDFYELMSRALLEFRLHGSTPQATKWLDQAEEECPGLLLRYVDGQASKYDEDDEAAEDADGYWSVASPVWRETEGTLAWVRQRVIQTKPQPPASLADRREEAERWVSELQKIPAGKETWRIVHREEIEIHEDGDATVIVFVMSQDGRDLLLTPMLHERPRTEDLLRIVVEACQEQEGRKRPREVVFEDPRLLKLAEFGYQQCQIQAKLSEPLPGLDEAITAHLEHFRQSLELPFAKLSDVEGLPELNEVWFVGFCRLRCWIEVDGKLIRPWMGIVLTPSGIRRHLQLTDPTVSEDDWEKLICSAMSEPLIGELGVPTELVFRNEPQLAAARSTCEAINVQARVRSPEEPDPVLTCAVDFSLRMEPENPDRHPLSHIGGLTLDEQAAFYAAAAEYHRAAPWRTLGEEIPMVLTGGDWPSGRVLCTMGQGGMTQGLSAMASLKEYAALSRTGIGRSLAVLLDEPQMLDHEDLDLIEAHGWPISNDQAYPVAYQTFGPQTIESPTRSDILMLTQALKLVPQLIRGGMQPVTVTDSAGKSYTISEYVATPKKPPGRPRKKS